MSDLAEAKRSLTSDFWKGAELHLHWRVWKTLPSCFQFGLYKIVTCILCSTCCFTAFVKQSGVYHWKRLTCIFQHGKETYQNVVCLNLIIFPIFICLGSQLIAGQAHKVKHSFAHVSPQLNPIKPAFQGPCPRSLSLFPASSKGDSQMEPNALLFSINNVFKLTG